MKQVNPYEKLIIQCIDLTGYSFRVSNISLNDNTNFVMEICNRDKDSRFDGMQIIFDDVDGYEVSEYQAGEKQNELHIYKVTKSLKVALKCYMKGNNQNAIKIWS